MSIAIVVTAIGFIVACIVSDVRARRIPNLLTLSGLIAGVALNVATGGGSGLLHSVVGLFVAVALLLPAFAGGGIGGGDVKMMAALGALLGARLVVVGLLCGMIAGGVVMLVHLWWIGRTREKLQATLHMAVSALRLGSLAPLKAAANDPAAVTLPYSVPLGLGVLLTISLGLMAGM